MDKPYLSIIVPIYNAEKYLRQCIDSILNQDFKDFELWLIDDGSSDSSIDIIKSYCSNDSRIKTAFIKGHGPSIPRNYALRRSQGEYILFIDSDDYLPPKSLSTLVAKSKCFPTATFIRGNQRILVDDTIEKKSVFAGSRSKYADQLIDGETFMVCVLDKDYAPIDSLIKRSYLVDNKIEFHEELMILEDGPFIIEIMGHNIQCVYINEETYVYRLGNATSVTNSKKSYPKCLSLVKGAAYNKSLMGNFSGPGVEHIRNRSIEHAVSSVFQAIKWTTSEEAKDIMQRVMVLWPKLPFAGRSIKHKGFIALYNVHPILAYYTVRLLKSIL